MSIRSAADRSELLKAIEEAQAGDLIEAASLAGAVNGPRELIALLGRVREKRAELVCPAEGVDTRGERGAGIASLCALLEQLERKEQHGRRQSGIERAREDGRYKGRKPIAVDETLFDSVAALWREGKITAREAMSRLQLKPNTFYRRIKEWEDQKMKDYKKIEEIREDIKQAAQQGRQDLHELREQVHAGAEELRQAAGEKLELHGVERELRMDRLRAEVEHADAVRQMKKDVEAETKELKKVLED
ncbi:MAG: recombinase family protein [Oscillospiraceae bacterium]|nr:recombinase family protein [Oscillospiraceae bacterium]